MILRGGKVRRRTWTHDGRKHESWGFTIKADGVQVRRQGWLARAEAQSALAALSPEERFIPYASNSRTPA